MKLDKFWTRAEPSAKPTLFSNAGESKENKVTFPFIHSLNPHFEAY